MVLRTDLLDSLPEELTQEQTITVEQILSGFYENLSAPQGDTRIRLARPAKDIDDFTDLVMRVLEEQQNREAVPANLRVVFTEEFPPSDMTTEVITFGLKQRMPASFSKGQHFNQQHVEVKPHIRSIDDMPELPGYKMITLGQRFENEIVFTCWAKTNKQANRRARWFEDLMRNWTWYIRYEGIEDFYFLGQDADIVLQLEGTEHKIVGRPMRYYVRTQRLSFVREPEIRHIVVRYGLGQQQ